MNFLLGWPSFTGELLVSGSVIPAEKICDFEVSPSAKKNTQIKFHLQQTHAAQDMGFLVVWRNVDKLEEVKLRTGIAMENPIIFGGICQERCGFSMAMLVDWRVDLW